MEAALDAGADDVITNEDGSIEVVCAPSDFERVRDGLAKAGLTPGVCRGDDEAHRGDVAVDAGLADLELADDVTELLLRRVDLLANGTRRVLTAAAAIGVCFEGNLLSGVCGIPEGAVLEALTDAAACHLIETVPGGGYGFLHDRIREVLLARSDPQEVSNLHHRIAVLLERSVDGDPGLVYDVAYHYLLGDTDSAPQDGYRAARAAGVHALAGYAVAEAVAYFRRAEELALAAGIPLDGAFHVGAGTAALRIGDFASADRFLKRALVAESDPLGRARIYIALIDAYQQRWEGDHALRVMRDGLAELGRPLPSGQVASAVTAAAALLRGLAIGGLPRWLSRLSGERRQRAELVVELLNAGAQAAGAAGRMPLMMALNLWALPSANRLGSGWPYLRSKVNLAILLAAMGRRGASRNLLAHAEAVAKPDDPTETAFVAWAQSLVADLVVGTDARTGEATRACLDRHGRWLDAGSLLTSVGILGVLQVGRGCPLDAMTLFQFGTSRTDDASQIHGTALGVVDVMALAMLGRQAEAAARLCAVREFLAQLPTSPGQQINVALAATVLAVEQGETGPVLEEALAEFHALGVSPGRVWPFQRLFWMYQAFGRLAEVVAQPADRAQRLAVATRAVKQLRRAANSPVLRGYHRVAEASLRQLEGDARGALRALAQCFADSAGLDVPLLQFEAARVATRCLLDLDRRADARRQATIARLLAEEGDWLARQRALCTEFGDEFRDPCGLPDAMTAAGSTSSRPKPTTGDGPRLVAPGGPGTFSGQRRFGRRMQALHEVSLAAATVLDPDQLARVALDEIVRIFGAERAFLFRADGATDQLTPHLGRDSEQRDLRELVGYGSSLVERVHQSGEPVVVTGSDQGAVLGSQSAVVYGLRSIMIAPLLLKGRSMGVVYLDSRAAKGIFTPDDVDLLIAITTNVALSLETVRAAQLEVAVQVARRERDTAELLRGVMNDLSASLDPSEVVARLTGAVVAVLPDTSVFLVHRAEDGGICLFGEREGEDRRDGHPAKAWRDLDREGGEVPEWLLEARSPVRGVCDRDPLPLPFALSPDTTGWLAVPLTVRGMSRGVLIAATDGREYTDVEVEIAAALAGQGMTALDNALLFRQVRDAATHDGLTGLFNRRYFVEHGERRLSDTRRDAGRAAAVMIDIDHFKWINDSHGHGVGDEVIRQIAHRLAEVVRGSDIVARYGGEEFAGLLFGMTVQDAVAAVYRLARRCLRGAGHDVSGRIASHRECRARILRGVRQWAVRSDLWCRCGDVPREAGRSEPGCHAAGSG